MVFVHDGAGFLKHMHLHRGFAQSEPGVLCSLRIVFQQPVLYTHKFFDQDSLSNHKSRTLPQAGLPFPARAYPQWPTRPLFLHFLHGCTIERAPPK